MKMKEELTRQGYKKFNPVHKVADLGFQKKMNGYFINMYWYDFEQFGKTDLPLDGWSAEAQFNTYSEKDCFNVELLTVLGKTVQEVESFFESIAIGMNVDRNEE